MITTASVQPGIDPPNLLNMILPKDIQSGGEGVESYDCMDNGNVHSHQHKNTSSQDKCDQ